MKRLILLLAASLILASPAFAWKEKVYRIEWSEWGLKDGMKSEQIAKQLDKKGVKYHPFKVSHANSYFPSDMFQIDSVQRWGITWDKVWIEVQKVHLSCISYVKEYDNMQSAIDIARLLKYHFENTQGFEMRKNPLYDRGEFYKVELFYDSTELDAPQTFEITSSKKYGSDKYQVELRLYSQRYNPLLM